MEQALTEIRRGLTLDLGQLGELNLAKPVI